MLEDVLLSHPGVADACVIGKPDAVAGELPMAFVVLEPGHTLTAQQIRDFVASKQRFIDHFRNLFALFQRCLLYTSPSPRDSGISRMPSSA